MTTILELVDIGFSYDQKPLLNNLNLKIHEGQVTVLVGESGSGKTTLLKLMNGMVRPQSGQINYLGEPFDFSKSVAMRRKMGYSIQGSGLFPHMNIFENITLVARKDQWSKDKIEIRYAELCTMVNLPTNREFRVKKPRELSGGQQQRAGIARALFLNPKILIMDEPFGALDPLTREEVQNEFLILQKKLNLTIIFVTHDLSESFLMGDKIVLLNKGKIEQASSPSRFLTDPESQYVRLFLKSHSPEKVLKSIKLYSVASKKIKMTIEKENKYIIVDMESGERENVDHIDKVKAHHQSINQGFIYWGDGDFQFLNYEPLNSDDKLNSNRPILQSNQSFLDGFKAACDAHFFAFPIVASDGRFVGVFNRRSLDVL